METLIKKEENKNINSVLIKKKKIKQSNSNKIIKKELNLYFHQKYAVLKNLEIISRASPFTEAVMGQLPRMGKSHIILGTILEFFKDLEFGNAMILSTAPNDSLPPLMEDLNKYEDFEDFYIQRVEEDINEKELNKNLKKKNIFLASKQFLQFRIDGKNILPLPKIDILFTDEIHNGGCTTLSNDIFKVYGAQAHKFYVSGTYGTAMDYFRIPTENLNLFDLESIALCKRITDPKYQQKIIDKHGPLMKKCIDEESNLKSVEDFFNRLPSLVIHSVNLTEDILNTIDEYNRLNETYYGLSLKALFELNSDKNAFEKPEPLVKLCKGIFTLENQNHSILDNVIEKNRKFNDRGFQLDYPSIIMCFLPFGRGQRINDVSKCFKELFIKEHINDDFDILILNDSDSTSDKTSLEKINKKYESIIGIKKGLIVLSGKKCVMGISIPRCDVVILFNHWSELNPIFQSMYRCMTDDFDEPMKNNKPQYIKKYGHVIDVNFHRQIQLIVDYSSNIFSGVNTQEAVKNAFDLNLFEIEQNSWHNTVFNEEEISMEQLSEKIYQTWFQSVDAKRVNNIMEDKFLENIQLDDEIINFMNGTNVSVNKFNQPSSVDIDIHKDHTSLKKGYKLKNKEEDEAIKGGIGNLKDEETDFEKEWKELQKFKEFLNHLIFLCILLTIYEDSLKTLNSMIEFINNNQTLKAVFYRKIRDWYQYENIHLESNQIKFRQSLNNLFTNFFPEGHQLHKNIKLMKETFNLNIKNPSILHRMIQQYISATEIEVKNFGNVSTPCEIINELFNNIPDKYWEVERKVYDPCCGKGTFLLKVIDKMMIHLKKNFNSDEDKYKYIIENCIYYADLDYLNIFITNILLRKNSKNIKLNFYCGNSIHLNHLQNPNWNIQSKFDFVCMNPPFTDGSGARGANHKLWDHFVKKALHELLVPCGILMVIHPSGWRHVNGICGDYIKEHQMVYLKIFNDRHGKKLFNCNVRFDTHITLNTPNERPTKIIDEDGRIVHMNIKDKVFIPNKNIEYIYSLVADTSKGDKCLDVLYERSLYGTDKKHMNKTKTDVFKYPCVYSVKTNEEMKFFYSNEMKGHFGIPKLIFGSGATGFYIDRKGEYGLTNYAKAIVVKPEDLDKLYHYIKSDRFNILKESLYITMNEINYQVLKLFKNDFWKNSF